jgi:hypothetical protein
LHLLGQLDTFLAIATPVQPIATPSLAVHTIVPPLALAALVLAFAEPGGPRALAFAAAALSLDQGAGGDQSGALLAIPDPESFVRVSARSTR